jgi:coenzyme F420-0:L-glutamate ligase/coenzyme F420-1:gamma-L-glutamate ligase
VPRLGDQHAPIHISRMCRASISPPCCRWIPTHRPLEFVRALGCGAVIVSDTFGRPWREGLVNVAIGVSGLEPLDDLRGVRDWSGRPLQVTRLAVADELAAAAGLAIPKSACAPVALITANSCVHLKQIYSGE